jgi:predicted permease
MVIAVVAGSIGLLLAYGGTRIMAQTAAQQLGLPRPADIRVDWIVFLFALGVSLLASLIFGLSPAVHASRIDVNDALKQAGRGLAGTSNASRYVLVVTQVALSFALAIGAGLLVRSFQALNRVDLGYRTDGMLVMEAHDPAHTLDDYLRASRFFQTGVERVRQIPGVVAAAAAMGVPTGRYGSNGAYVVDGADFRQRITAHAQAIFSLSGPGYFSGMGIPLVRGRDFTAEDGYQRPFVAIVSESLARQSFGGQDPIGHTIMCGLDALEWMTIVGVVADVRQDSPASLPAPTLYMPLLQHPYHANEVQILVRSAVSPLSLAEPVSRTLRALNPDVAMRFTTLDAMRSSSIATPRLRMVLVELFAALAVLLAIAGMYGVMTCITTQRVPEFGVRMALGASGRTIVALVLRRAMQMTAIGIVLGLGLALAAARVLNTLLFGLRATDAITYAVVVLAFTPLVVLAAAIPAWRAARVDPVVALRFE